jgi:drug/metabolite transporter (DMT)-like permease
VTRGARILRSVTFDPGRVPTGHYRFGVAIVLALGAALLFAVASVLQQRAASEAPEGTSMRIGLMLHLLRRPLWLAGYAADWGGFGLQALALGVGSLLVVQPLLVTGLLFALPIGAAWAGRRLSRSDWIAAVVLTLGLAAFLLEGSPTGGIDQAAVGPWLVCGAVAGVLIGASVLSGLRTSGTTRAVFLAFATGLCYGVTAALTKTTMSLLSDGLGAAVTSWEPYALTLLASLGMVINQSAFQAGALSASLPTLTIVEPIAAAVIGVTLMEERIQASTPLEWAAITLSVVAMAYGVIVLARRAAASEVTTPTPVVPAPTV